MPLAAGSSLLSVLFKGAQKVTTMKFAKYSALVSIVMFAGPWAFAQNVGGVFGPNVTEGDKSWQYRAGFSPGEDDGPDRFVHRFHYQQAINDSVRWRVVVQGSDLEDGNLEGNFVVGELHWQFLDEKKDGWSSAFRVDGRLSEGDDGAHLIGLNWTSQVPITEDLSFVGVILLAEELGDRARDGTFAQTRASLTYKLDGGNKIGVEMFNVHGDLGDLQDLDQQNLTIGPTFSTKLGGDWSLFTGVQFGLTDPARDTDLRLWIGRPF